MFPWSPEFSWDLSHLVFFGALYSVLAAIASALGVAGWRAFRHVKSGRLDALVWQAEFHDLSRSARACRHQITGEAPGRVCENGFDCRNCTAHPELERLRPPQAEGHEAGVGFELPLDRYYHRGHTWARIEPDGIVSVGLDDLARRLVGEPEAVELPRVGDRLRVNGPLAQLVSRGARVRLLSPLDGTVLALEGTAAGFVMRVVPMLPVDARHLLWGAEARAWALRELERLQRACGVVGAEPTLADGGELLPDLGRTLTRARYEALVGEMLLEP